MSFNEEKIYQELEIYKAELEAQNEELLQTQEELVLSLENNKYLFEHAPIAYITIDSNANIIDYNFKADEIFHISRNKIKKNRYLMLLIDTNDALDFMDLLKDENFDTKVRDFRFRINDKLQTFQVSIQRKASNNKEFLVCLTNIQKELDMIEQIKQSIKTSEIQAQTSILGEMFDNITHQWKQPLSLIVSSSSFISYLIQNNQLQENVLKQEIEMILDISKYMAKTIDEFKSFALNESIATKFNIKETVEKTVSVFNKKLLDNKIVSFDLENIEFFGNENLLVQVLSNIINNAKDQFRIKKIKNQKIEIKSYKDGNLIYITVKDNAGGIQKEVQDKVFEPYVTTKKEFKGTGIGLYMAKEIMRKNFNGDLTFENHDDGVEFTIKINSIN